MPNGKDDHRYLLPRPPSRLDNLERTVGSVIDFMLALHALSIAKGTFTHEELLRMADIVAKARPKLSETFTIEEGLKAIMVAFRIEGQSGKGEK